MNLLQSCRGTIPAWVAFLLIPGGPYCLLPFLNKLSKGFIAWVCFACLVPVVVVSAMPLGWEMIFALLLGWNVLFFLRFPRLQLLHRFVVIIGGSTFQVFRIGSGIRDSQIKPFLGS